MIYLDNAATTPIHPAVLEAMMPYLKDDFGNAGTMYELGRRAADAMAKARKQVAELIGTTPEHIVFTSGGSEANNLAIHGLLPHLTKIGKTHIITSMVEHDSVLKAVNSVCNPLGDNTKNNIKHDFGASFLSVDRNGVISVDELESTIRPNTGLVSVMYVNNESGVVMPVREISDICRKQKILFHTDCVQALGFQDINVEQIGCDLLSISAHKINAPKGVGALYVRDPNLLSPIICGGAYQEHGLRGGTENVAGIVGFGEACNIIQNETVGERSDKLYCLRSVFVDALKESLVKFSLCETLHFNSPDGSKMLNIRFDRVDGQTLLLMLDAKGVCVSAGSACRSHETHPSHVLLAMGLSEDEAKDSIRISFDPHMTYFGAETAAVRMSECVAALNGIVVNEGV